MKSGHAFGGTSATLAGFRRLKCVGILWFLSYRGGHIPRTFSPAAAYQFSDVRQKVFLFTTLAGHKAATSGVQISG